MVLEARGDIWMTARAVKSKRDRLTHTSHFGISTSPLPGDGGAALVGWVGERVAFSMVLEVLARATKEFCHSPIVAGCVLGPAQGSGEPHSLGVEPVLTNLGGSGVVSW